MKRGGFFRREEGTSAIEFAITAPVLFMLIIGGVEGAILLWTQLGLQHGAEMAARCSTVNKTLCNNAAATKDYAVQRSLGVNPPASVFSVDTLGCGIQVSASYTYEFVSGYFGSPSVVLTAQACVPQRL
jgi:Flp pilus assembly protein TadG